MRVRHRLAALLFALLAGAAVWQGGVTPAGAATLQLGAAALALAAACRPELRGAPAGALAVALAWSGLALGSTLWSVSRDPSLDGAGALLAGAVVFVLAAALLDPGQRRRFAMRFAALGAAVGSLAIASALPGERAVRPFGNPNHLAGWLLLPTGIALVHVLRGGIPSRGRRETALLWFGLLTLGIAGVVATRSRGAVVAGLVAVAGLGALVRLGPRRSLPLLGAAGAAAAVALALLPALLPDVLPAHPAAGESSAGMRWALYGAVARAIPAQAPLGVGIGAFGPGFHALRPGTIPYRVDQAHSEPLHGALELGIPFVALLGVTICAATRRAALRLPRSGSRTTWGLAVALLALAAHALVDFPLHVPAIALAGAVLAGALWRATQSGATTRSDATATRVVLAALGALLLVLAGTRTAALAAERRAELALARGDFAAAERAARVGLRLRPARAALWGLVGEAAEEAHRIGAEGAAARVRARAARARAVAASPREAALHLAAARTEWRAGALGSALRAVARARDLDRNSAAPELVRARMLLEAGRREEAASAVRAAVERQWWVSDVALLALLRATDDPKLVQAAVPRDAVVLRQAGRLLRRHGHARAAADSFDRAVRLEPGDVDLVLEATGAWLHAGATARARDTLRRGLARRPEDPRLVEALARLPVERAQRERS